jgi:GTP-binding protein
MAMLREHKAPLGGPAGGDGGPGGAVILRGDESLHSLEGVRRRVHYKGEDGGNGLGKSRHGSRGADCIIPVCTLPLD